MKRAFGYIRVSTERQALSGLSIADQRAAIEQWCLLNGYELARIYVDAGVSSKIPWRQREEGEKLFLALQPGDTFVTKTLSRPFRNFVEACDQMQMWQNADINFVCIDFHGLTIDYSTPIGKFIFHVMAALWQFERELIAERVQAAMHVRKQRGFRQGDVAPFGHKWVERKGAGELTFEPDPEQLEQIARVQELHAAKHSIRDIVRLMRKIKRPRWRRKRSAVFIKKNGSTSARRSAYKTYDEWSIPTVQRALAFDLETMTMNKTNGNRKECAE